MSCCNLLPPAACRADRIEMRTGRDGCAVPARACARCRHARAAAVCSNAPALWRRARWPSRAPAPPSPASLPHSVFILTAGTFEHRTHMTTTERTRRCEHRGGLRTRVRARRRRFNACLFALMPARHPSFQYCDCDSSAPALSVGRFCDVPRRTYATCHIR